MSENLYELSTELARIHDELVDSGGELTDELEKRLDESGLAFTAKVENIVRWTRNLSTRSAAIKAEIDRLTALKKSADNLEKRLKAYVQMCMEMAGKEKVEYDLFTVRLQKNPPSAEVMDEGATPAKFLTIIPEQKVPDRKAILEALKGGEKVKGWQLVTERKHLRIK